MNIRSSWSSSFLISVGRRSLRLPSTVPTGGLLALCAIRESDRRRGFNTPLSARSTPAVGEVISSRKSHPSIDISGHGRPRGTPPNGSHSRWRRSGMAVPIQSFRSGTHCHDALLPARKQSDCHRRNLRERIGRTPSHQEFNGVHRSQLGIGIAIQKTMS